MTTAEQRQAAAKRNGNGHEPPKPALNELGEKIFLDRYALKDMTKQSLAAGDTVIVCVNQKTRQREIGTVVSLGNGRVEVQLRDGSVTEQGIEDVDKPLETEPGQMMDRVARGIAAIETSPDKQAEWEANFRWLLDEWKFVPGGRILTAAGTDQQLTFFNCMPPEQEILTAQGYKAIAEVSIGDQVVTHRNRLRRVLHKFERETEELLYIVKTKKLGYDDLRVTGEHKVFAIRSEWVNKHKSRDGLRLQQEPQWIPAKDLKPGDYVAAAYDGEEEAPAPIYVSEYIEGYAVRDGALYKPQQRADYHGHLTAGGTHHDVTDRLVIDRDLCYLFGRWLGDGNINHRAQSDIPSGIKLVFGLDEREEAESIAQIIENKFGVKTYLKVSSTERWLDLWANSMALGQFFKAFFGAYSYGKRIPAQLSRLPRDLGLALLKGLFTADGYVSDNKLGILLSNRTLATQVHQQLLRLGFLFSIKENTHRLGRRPAYRLQATANECAALFTDFFDVEAPPHNIDVKHYFEHDGLRWLRIDEIAVEDYAGVVLDIEVEEDHSFISAGVVVSNCYVVPSPQDSRRGIVDTLSQMMEIMSRGGGVGINLSSLRPQHAYVKGVNGRSSGSVSWGGLYSFVTGLIEQGGSRRGALMLILNVWHPDVLSFINSKREMGKITNANISVGLTDNFMAAVQADASWELVFPDPQTPGYNEDWDGDIEKWRAAGKPVNVHKTIKARELWNNIIESAWASAEPGLWFIDRTNKMSNSFYFSPLICTNPCGEQPLPAWGICNLGAINLGKFVKNKEVVWDDLRQAVRYAVRFLDNVIDATPYFFDENQQQQQNERRVGLGIMGLADMLIRLGIRYGSDECLTFLDQLGEVLASEAYYASADNAAEKGAFPQFDAEKLLQSGYMQAMPEPVRQAVRDQGLRNVTLLTVAPTGCVAPNTLVSTATGLRPIVELGNPNGEQWQNIVQQVHTDVGLRTAARFFVNGRRAVNTLTTKRGFSLTATPNHRIRVIDVLGNYVWRRMDELVVGDQVVLKKGTLGDGEPVHLTPVGQGVNSRSSLPTMMTPELAELLGLYMGDGYVKDTGGLHIVACKDDPDLVQHIQELMRQVWGDRYINVEERVGCWTVNLNGRYIPRFFEANGLAKPRGNQGEGAQGAFIPSKILQAGRTCIAAFLRGLFEADGSISRGTITLVSTSQDLIKQVQVALLGLSIVATTRIMPASPDKFGQRTMYELRILNRREAQQFVSEVGFISHRKRTKAVDLGATSDRGDHIANAPLCEEFYVQSKGLKNNVRQTIIQRVSNGSLTQQFVKGMVSDHAILEDTRIARLVAMDAFIDEVVQIDDGVCDTYDLSVPSNETYIANGFISHNTTGTMVATSTGVEPYFSWSYFRKSRLGVHEEKVAIVEEWQQANPGQPLPSYFVSAMELSPIEHVNVQAALQRWIDSAISKTANLPHNYTVEQTRELYEYMYKMGCKGGTIYRDGSRDEQVLNLKKEEAKQPEPQPVAEAPKKSLTELWNQPKIRPRPKRSRGVTVQKESPLGSVFVTVNDDDGGEPLEIFVTAGKAGSDVTSMAEALGRLASLVLRVASPVTPKERLSQIASQLKGIGGARSMGFGKDRVRSLPDAVAQAIEECCTPEAEAAAAAMATNDDGHKQVQLTLPSIRADLCPSCGEASFVHEEGCMHCNACGFSQC